MYIYFNNNPCLRVVGDCAVRAVSKALDTSWERAYAQMIVVGFKLCDMPSSNAVTNSILKAEGFKKAMPEDSITVEQFSDKNIDGIYVMGTGTHLVTEINGDYYDAWQSGSEIISYVWYKGNPPVF